MNNPNPEQQQQQQQPQPQQQQRQQYMQQWRQIEQQQQLREHQLLLNPAYQPQQWSPQPPANPQVQLNWAPGFNPPLATINLATLNPVFIITNSPPAAAAVQPAPAVPAPVPTLSVKTEPIIFVSEPLAYQSAETAGAQLFAQLTAARAANPAAAAAVQTVVNKLVVNRQTGTFHLDPLLLPPSGPPLGHRRGVFYFHESHLQMLTTLQTINEFAALTVAAEAAAAAAAATAAANNQNQASVEDAPALPDSTTAEADSSSSSTVAGSGGNSANSANTAATTAAARPAATAPPSPNRLVFSMQFLPPFHGLSAFIPQTGWSRERAQRLNAIAPPATAVVPFPFQSSVYVYFADPFPAGPVVQNMASNNFASPEKPPLQVPILDQSQLVMNDPPRSPSPEPSPSARALPAPKRALPANPPDLVFPQANERESAPAFKRSRQ